MDNKTKYMMKYRAENYESVRADIRKGIKPLLLEEFKKDGYASMASGLLKLILDYLESKGIDVTEFKKEG